MKVFVAGATGAIGQPLIAELIAEGHTVTGMTHSEAGARRLRAAGVDETIADALNGDAVEGVLRASHAEVVIDELTAIPRMPSDLSAHAHVDQKLRIEGGNNLHRAALACGVRRYIQQSSGFFLDAKEALADESSPLALNASPGIAKYAQMYAYVEQRVLESSIEGVALRYGFFYGPNTWYNPDGGAADEIRKQLFPVIEGGKAKWSFVHIEDAARATVAVLTAEPGKYVVVDDDTSPVNVWLPRFASFVGAPAPPFTTKDQVLQTAGEDAVYYQTQLCGASNAKAKRELHFAPRRREWLSE
ncbi:MAG: NAD-dependent epimerase/dehydratase [Acidobacteriaceae bacterium]|nr:NAD-dependent epimerase/dehydratase [Acidobacteriaceae bacterium]